MSETYWIFLATAPLNIGKMGLKELRSVSRYFLQGFKEALHLLVPTHQFFIVYRAKLELFQIF